MPELMLAKVQSPTMKKSRLPRFERVGNPPRMVLMPRDRKILLYVYLFRMLTREQIERLLFQSENGHDHSTLTSKAILRLKLLYQHGYLERIPLPVGEGSWAWIPVYRLSAKGAEVVAKDLGKDKKDLIYWGKADDRQHRTTHVTPLFLEHTLRINDIRIAVTLAAREKGYRVEKWLDEAQLKSQEMKEYVPVRDENGNRMVGVVPDGYFVLHLGDRRAHFFLELDRATMSNSRWATRVRAYLEYIDSGKYTERYQTTSLRILTVTTTEKRLKNLKETTRKTGGENLFWFTTLDQVSPSTVFFRPIWLLANDASGDESNHRARKSLLG